MPRENIVPFEYAGHLVEIQRDVDSRFYPPRVSWLVRIDNDWLYQRTWIRTFKTRADAEAAARKRIDSLEAA